jgi:hypothetical protein
VKGKGVPTLREPKGGYLERGSLGMPHVTDYASHRVNEGLVTRPNRLIQPMLMPA